MLAKIRDERLSALTGLTQEKFTALTEGFAETYETEKAQVHEPGGKQRRPGAGRKGKLPSAEAKLLFLLYYY